MKEVRVTVPELELIAGTRAALGIGIGLLLSNRLSVQERRGAGWALFLVGALTTIPLMVEVFGRPRSFRIGWESEDGKREPRADFRVEHRKPSEMVIG